jgi:hypothetical protein
MIDILDILHEINSERFEEFFEIENESEDLIHFYHPDQDNPIFHVDIKSSKRVSIELPEYEWLRWVCHVVANDMAFEFEGKIKNDAETIEPDVNKFNGGFSDYVKMTKIHNPGHYNWIENQIPEDLMGAAFPEGNRLADCLDWEALKAEQEELVDA